MNLSQWIQTGVTTFLIPYALGAGCLSTQAGCQSDEVRRAFGYSNPTLEVKHSFFGGTSFKAGSNFSGELDAVYNPDTNAIEVHARADSNVADVLGAEGARITEQFLAARAAEYAYRNRQAEIVGDNFRAFGTMIAIATAAGGDAVQQVIDAAAPILAGSGATLDITGLGHAGINLGQPLSGTPPPQPIPLPEPVPPPQPQEEEQDEGGGD
jgi:hypothetical protein